MARSLFRVCSLFFCGFAEGQGTLHNRKVKKTCFFFLLVYKTVHVRLELKAKKTKHLYQLLGFPFLAELINVL